MTRTVILGATVCDHEAVHDPGYVVIEDQSIVEAGPGEPAALSADEIIDARGHIVVPGGIDPHVHFETPGWSYREDFYSGTSAAAAAGVTLVVEHPISDPPTTTAQRFADKRDIVASQAIIDVALWGALTPDSLVEMEGQAELGAAGYKAFMCGSSDFYRSVDDATLYRGMVTAARLGRPVLVHAESEAVLQAGLRAMRAAGRSDPVAHALSRPPIAEEAAVDRACSLASKAGAHLHVVHVSSPDSVEIIERTRNQGSRVTFEITPHHLLLDTDDLKRLGPWARCAPPLRDRALVDKLWSAVISGALDCFATDHAPYTLEEKLAGADDIFAAPNGMQLLQEGRRLFFSEAVTKRGVPLPQFVRQTATNAARLLGLFPQKGTLMPGADADIVLLRPDADAVVRAEEQFSKHPWTPFDGRPLSVVVSRTLARGRTVYDRGAITAEPGTGRFLAIGSR